MKKIIFCLLVFVIFSIPVVFCEAQVIITFAGTGMSGYTGDGGAAIVAELKTPSGVAVDNAGNVYLTDQNGSCLRKIDAAGIITSIAGNSGVAGYAGDGGPATAAKLNWPEGLAIDDTGNIFIADQFNNVIRKVSAVTGIITTIAGDNALIGYSGDGGPATAAALWHPSDVAVDRSGNVYFADQDNSVTRKVNPGGIISILAGIPDSAGYSGDGGSATAAKINHAQGIAADSAGNVYIADYYNSRIRKVAAGTGIITTVAGNGTGGYGGDAGPATDAEIYDASAVAVDDTGNIYISDYYNSRIRKVSAATGIITTISGNGTAAYCCDCRAATAAEIYYPEGVAVDKRGNVYIADYGNSRVREVTDSFYCPSLATKNAPLSSDLEIFPNPSQGHFYVQLNNIQSHEKAEIYNAMGEKVYEAEINTPLTDFDLYYLPPGVYMIHVVSDTNYIIKKITIIY